MSDAQELRSMADKVEIAQAVLPWFGPLAWYASLFLNEPAKKLRDAADELDKGK